MPKKLDHYKSIVSQGIKNDSDFVKMAESIDNMWECKWSLPEGLKDKTWMREFITTSPHDAMWAAGRVSVSKMPDIRVIPFGSADMERAEQIESLLDWNFYKTIKRSPRNPFVDLVMSAIKYSRVALQTVYLPYEFKNKSEARYKNILANGDFAIKVHNPQNVHATYSDYGLDTVSLAVTKTARELVSLYPQIERQVRAQVFNGKKEDEELMSSTWFTLYDYTDYEDRVIWTSMGSSEYIDPNGGNDDSIVIENNPHGLPFMPWVYKQDDNPLMKPVVDANLFSNANILESLRYFLVISTVAQARSWSKTLEGNGVEIDHSEPASQVTMNLQEDFGLLPPSQLDPNLSMLIDSVRADIRQTTVAEALTTIDRLSANTPFATVNAIMKAAIESLSPVHKVIEGALEDAFVQMLQWVKYTKIPLRGYKRKTTSIIKQENMLGAELVLSDEDFDPKDIHLTVTLNTETATDKDAALNRAILISSRLPVAPRKALEESGYDYNDADFEEYLNWKYVDAENQADLKRIILQPDLELQAQQMQMQMSMQQQQMEMQRQMAMQQQGGQEDMQMAQENQMVEAQNQEQLLMQQQQQAEGNPIFEGAQGETGLSPANIAPNMTREKVSNKDTNGFGL